MNAKQKTILTIPVAITSYSDSVKRIIKAAGESVGQYVCVSNVHMCMEAFDCARFNKVVNDADMVVPDGVPLVWALKALGEKDALQVRGSDLMMRLCEEAQKLSIPIGLYGGTPDNLIDLRAPLIKKFPSLKIPFYSSPPFRELSQEEKNTYIKEINATGAKILFVGIGCPKQENWMAEHRNKLSCVMLGVGAAFDFFTGRKKSAPRWMQKYGLEWAFRLADEPKRLWWRYLKHNPRFIYYFFIQWVKHKMIATAGSKHY